MHSKRIGSWLNVYKSILSLAVFKLCDLDLHQCKSCIPIRSCMLYFKLSITVYVQIGNKKLNKFFFPHPPKSLFSDGSTEVGLCYSGIQRAL